MNKLFITTLFLIVLSNLVVANDGKSHPSNRKVKAGNKVTDTGNQDCVTAKPICTTAAFTDNSKGMGLDTNDINVNTASCFFGTGYDGNEHESSWYYFKIASSGTLAFTIKSKLSGDDFDFAVWGPMSGCPITTPSKRCNTYGDPIQLDSTGLNFTDPGVTSTGPGSGFAFLRWLDVNAGETYYLLIDKYTKSDSAFTISFSGTATLNCDIVQASIEFTKDTICAGASTSLNTKSTQTESWYVFPDTLNAFSTSQNVSVTPSITTTYVVKGKNDANQDYRLTKVIVVNPLPVIIITATNDTICKGNTTVLDASGGTTYQWALANNPGNVISSSSSLSVSPSLTTQYIVTATLNGCSATHNKTITVIDKPVFTVTGNDSICPNQSRTVSVSSGNQYTYEWAEASNPSLVIGTGSSITVTPTSTTSYIVTATFQGLCSDTRTFTVGVITPPVITPSCLNTGNICMGDAVQLQGAGAISYSWQNKTTGTPVGSGVQISVFPSATTTYSVIGTDSKGCTGSSEIIITVNPLPSVFIFNSSGVDTVCSGDMVQLIGLNAQDYSWTTTINPLDTLSKTATLIINPTVTTTYVVKGTDTKGCNNIYSKEIYVMPLPQLTASLDTLKSCPGINNIINVISNHLGSNTFEWYDLSTSTQIGSTAGITVTPVSNTTYLVKTTDSKGCTGTIIIPVMIYPEPITSGIFAPTTSICPGYKDFLFTAKDTLNNSTYKWLVNGGTIASGQSINTSQIKIDWKNQEDSTAYIKVVETSKNGCIGDTVTLPIHIEYNLHPQKANGLITLCSKDAVLSPYSIIPLNGSVYTWGVVGGTIQGVSGQGNSTASVNWDTNPNSSIHKIFYREDNGPCYGFSDTLSVVVNPSPTASFMIGKDSVCSGETNSVYGLNGLSGSKYSWRLSKNTHAFFSRNDSSASAEVNWPVVFVPETDTLFVTETSDKGCKGETLFKVITISLPHSPEKILGPDYICIDPEHPTDVFKQYTALNGLQGSRFVWSISGNGASIDSTKKDTVYIHFSGFQIEDKPTLNVYEVSKDSCAGEPISKIIRFDFVKPYMQKAGTKVKDDHVVEVSWDSSYNALGQQRSYTLFKRKLYSNDPWQNLGTKQSNKYLDTAVRTSQYAYAYKYQTQNICDDSASSKTQNTILLTGKADEKQNAVSLGWNSYHNWQGGVLQYEVWRRLDNEGDYQLYSKLGPNDTIISYANGYDGFTHHYRIRALQDTSIQAKESWSNILSVDFEHAVFIPNVITPNGDGTNDSWKIPSMQAYKAASIEVYNRWGSVVFSYKGIYQSDWSGTSNGKDLPDGTYFYIIKLNENRSNKSDTFTGNLTIIR